MNLGTVKMRELFVEKIEERQVKIDFDIKHFDDYRENYRLEAKKTRGGLPNSLWDTYSAMANCYGGVILLGVIEREDGSFATTGLKILKN